MRKLVLILAAGALAAPAHDFWLWPQTFRPAAGDRVTIEAGVGEEFPAFTNKVTLDRIEGLRLIAPDGRERPVADLGVACPGPGTWTLALTVKPRYIELAPADFQRYATGEEFQQVLRARRDAGADGKPGREIYSRCSKLLLHAPGNQPSDAATRPVGHELEIIPLITPVGLKAGEALPVRVIFRGKPLAGARVAAAYAGSLRGKRDHSFPVVARTDQNGETRLLLDRGGAWYVRMIHMIPYTGGSGLPQQADWRSYFATLTFQAGE